MSKKPKHTTSQTGRCGGRRLVHTAMVLAHDDLTEPERAIWDAIGAGKPVKLPLRGTASGDPAEGATWGGERLIRAQLLYELLAGINGPKDVRARSLKLAGARIIGTLDLEATELVCPLRLEGCSFEEPVNLKEARAPALRLPGCHLHGLTAQQLHTRGNLELTDGCTVKGNVDLAGAHIGGDLRLQGAVLSNCGGRALSADCLTVARSVHCSNGFKAHGYISLVRARIGGQLTFSDSDVWLCNACRSTLTRQSPLNLEQAQAARLVLSPLRQPPTEVDLTYARFVVLVDHPDRGPRQRKLHGLVYDALDEEQEMKVNRRLTWLDSDPEGYSPQPYEQLAAVYRKAGRDDDARKVAIAKQRRRRQALNWPGRVWNRLLHWTVGYGYSTWKAAIWLAALWIVGASVFLVADAHGQVSPAKMPLELQHFNPAVFALDVLLPIVSLGQEGGWVPHRYAAMCYWLLALAGWALTTAVVAALTGLIKKE
jgi:hypothetical protein